MAAGGTSLGRVVESSYPPQYPATIIGQVLSAVCFKFKLCGTKKTGISRRNQSMIVGMIHFRKQIPLRYTTVSCKIHDANIEFQGLPHPTWQEISHMILHDITERTGFVPTAVAPQHPQLVEDVLHRCRTARYQKLHQRRPQTVYSKQI